MTDPVLQLEKAQGILRKISVNVLNKNADFTLFTLPIEGIPLNQEQLDAFMGEYTFRSWYDQKPDGAWHPCAWWGSRKNGWELDGRFACSQVTLTIEGKDWTFEEYRADEEDDDEDEEDGVRPGGRITSVTLTPTAGGTTLLSFHLQVRPQLGKASTALLAHMYRAIAVTLQDASVEARDSKQQSLPLPDQTGHQSPPPIVSKGGDAIDAELHAEHPELSGEVMGADKPPDTTAPVGGMDPALEADVQKFEADAQARIDEFKSRAANAVDGTTMRSRRRRKGGDDATH